MSLFSKILSKLGFGENKAEAAPTVSPTPAPATPAPAAPKPAAAPAVQPASPAATAPAAAPVKPQMRQVDVVSKLAQLASANPEKLNWRESIVDLMKLLDMDSSLASRKDLAIELGYPRDKTDDSAQMNLWLHKTVLQKLSENGGNVPPELLG